MSYNEPKQINAKDFLDDLIIRKEAARLLVFGLANLVAPVCDLLHSLTLEFIGIAFVTHRWTDS